MLSACLEEDKILVSYMVAGVFYIFRVVLIGDLLGFGMKLKGPSPNHIGFVNRKLQLCDHIIV